MLINNQMKSYIFTIIILFAFLLPLKQSEAFVSFGAYTVWSVPCTCSGAAVWYTWQFPLFINSPIPLTGPLAMGLPPTALWYKYYDPIVPTTWSLGKFMPGVQSCWQPIGTGCAPWPVIGHVYEVGSSLPFSKP